MDFWGQRSFVLVTGASRGIGRCIAVEFAKKVGNESVILITARSQSALEETKKLITFVNPSCQVLTKPLDLSKPDKQLFLSTITSCLTEIGKSSSTFDHVMIIHNAGSLGNTKKRVVEMDDVDEIEDYYRLNVTSMLVLNSQFFKVFNDKGKQRSVIQITSLAGLQPFKTWGYYGAGKAARDQYIKVLALEEGIQVLSWAPGPVDTEMFDEACKETGDPEIVKAFKELREKRGVLKPEETVGKLVKVLGTKKYVNGEHVDYYDIE